MYIVYTYVYIYICGGGTIYIYIYLICNIIYIAQKEETKLQRKTLKLGYFCLSHLGGAHVRTLLGGRFVAYGFSSVFQEELQRVKHKHVKNHRTALMSLPGVNRAI